MLAIASMLQCMLERGRASNFNKHTILLDLTRCIIDRYMWISFFPFIKHIVPNITVYEIKLLQFRTLFKNNGIFRYLKFYAIKI